MQCVHSLNLNLTETFILFMDIYGQIDICSFIHLIYIKDVKLREQLTPKMAVFQI